VLGDYCSVISAFNAIIGTGSAARLLGVSPQTVESYIHGGQLQAFRLGGSWRLDRLAVERARDAGVNRREVVPV
jgi:excisionase family DNA binding protein